MSRYRSNPAVLGTIESALGEIDAVRAAIRASIRTIDRLSADLRELVPHDYDHLYRDFVNILAEIDDLRRVVDDRQCKSRE